MAKNKNNVSKTFLVALGAALVLGGVFTYLSLQFFKTEDIVVATNTLKPYEKSVTSADFTIISISKRDMANFKDCIIDINSLNGKMPITDIIKGQPVKASQFINPTDAAQISNIVNGKNYRGLYMTLNKENTLNGLIQTGTILDLYITTTILKPTVLNPQNKESIVVPFQKSFKVTKFISNEDKSISLFVQFPMEESEKYVMLNDCIKNKTMTLVATVPNAIHDDYNGAELTYTDFYNALIANSSYFKSVSDLQKDKTSSTKSTNSNTDTNTATVK